MNEPTTVYQGDQELPPPGYERQEVLKERTDTLEQKAEEIADAHDIHKVNPDSIAPDREILHVIDACEVTHAQPGYRYKWVQDQWPSQAKSLEVRRTRAIHVRVDGKTRPAWEIVLHDMPESPELRQADGVRRVGDCILMRCRADVHMMLQLEEQKKRDRQVGSLTDNLDALGEYGRKKGCRTAHGNVARGGFVDQMHANQIAKSQFGDMVRDGNIPGMQMPNNRR